MSGRVWGIVGGFLLLVPLFHVAGLLWLIWFRSFDVPVIDEWSLLFLMREFRDGTLGFDDFWGYQSVHRIVATRVVSWPLMELTGWNRQVLMTLGLITTVATMGFLLQSVGRSTGILRAGGLRAAGLTLLFLSFAQARVWLQPFLIAFILASFGAALTTWGLTQPRTRTWPFALAIVGALVSSLSFLAGLFTWFVFLPAVWFHGRRRTAMWLVATVAVCVPYLWGFPANYSDTGGVLSVGDAVGGALGYVLAYLGGSISNLYLERAQVFGALSVGLMVLNLFLMIRQRRRFDDVLPWLGLAVFVVATGLLTFLGRSELGADQPLSHRYQPIQSLWWVSVAVVAVMTCRDLRSDYGDRTPRSNGNTQRLRTAIVGVNALVGLLATGGALLNEWEGYDHVSGWLDLRRLNQSCAVNFERATENCLQIYTDPPLFPADAPFLRENDLAMFRTHSVQDPETIAAASSAAVGDIISIDGKRPTTNRNGPIELTADRSVTMIGWALDPTTDDVGGGILIDIDDATPIIGLYGTNTPPSVTNPDAAGGNAGFVATLPAASLSPGEHTLTVRVLSPDRATSYEVPLRVDIVATPPGADASGTPVPASRPDRRGTNTNQTTQSPSRDGEATPRADRRPRRTEPKATREGGRRRRAGDERTAPVEAPPLNATPPA